MKTPIRHILLALVAMLVTGVTAASAQGDPNRISITVGVSDNTPGGLPAAVFRRTSEPRNLVVVNSATMTAASISQAVHALLLFEARDPTGAERTNNKIVSSRIDKSRSFSWAKDITAQLKNATPRVIEGVGRVRAVEINEVVPRIRKK